MPRTANVRMLASVLVLGVAAAACTEGPADRTGGVPADDIELLASLAPFEACDDLLDYFVEHALEIVGPYGLYGGHHPRRGGFDIDVAETETTDGGTRAVADDAGAPAAGEDYSATNVQEAGVDEPDLVKTDGERLVTVLDDRLHVVDVRDGDPASTGRVRLPSGAGRELLLVGDHAVVLGRSAPGAGPAGSSSPAWGGSTTMLTLVDLSGPPQVVETLTVDGALVSARLVDGVVRAALRTHPVGLDFVTPQGEGLRAEREATERNREVVRESTIANWLPYYLWERSGRVAGEGELLGCDDVHRPETFGGLGLAAVLAVDPEDGIRPMGTSAVVGAADTVYATPENLYVATQRWQEMLPGRDGARSHDDVTTALHRFSIADPRAPRYEASGEVPGRLLDQWALSEHEGHLRVATTTGDPWGPEEGPDASRSAVRVLDAELAEVGAVDGLGIGERIYAVRYAGDIGYVVTFRETDPLYTVDLSDPADPTVLGELKITGYSGYLHPLGHDVVMGVGQDGTDDGRLLGAQFSMFDVSDLSDPRRVGGLTVEDSHSAVEWDHRALLYWEPERLVVAPVEQWQRFVPGEDERPGGPGKPDRPFVGVLALRVHDDRLEEVARLEHAGDRDWAPPIERAVVVGEVLYTISRDGILASDLDTFDLLRWISL
jgi:hypothetical protein